MEINRLLTKGKSEIEIFAFYDTLINLAYKREGLFIEASKALTLDELVEFNRYGLKTDPYFRRLINIIAERQKNKNDSKK